MSGRPLHRFAVPLPRERGRRAGGASFSSPAKRGRGTTRSVVEGARLGAVIAAAVFCMAAASDPAERLTDPAQEARAREIFREVRCLVCQNESIDDSDAELAADLRRVVREQVAAGRSEGEVKGFLVQRYGEYVLLRPPMSAGNLVLWIAPFAVLLLGLAAFLALGRRRAAPEPLSEDEEGRIAALLEPQSRDDIKVT